MKKQELKYFCLFFVVNLIFAIITLIFFFPVYFETNDDFGISCILMGVYGDEYRQCLIYSNVILGFILKPLYYLSPAINWYVVFQYLFIIISISALMKIIAFNKSFILAFCVNLLSWYVFVFDYIRRIQFSRTAGFVMLVGMICILSYYIDKCYFDLIMGGALFTYGIMLRMDCVWLVLPYISLLVLYNVINKKIIVKDVFVFVICVCVFTIFLFTVDKLYYYSDPDWKNYIEYNKVRGQVTDYHLPDYEESEVLYKNAGVSENDILMIRNWAFADDRVFDTNKLRKIIDVRNIVNHRQFSMEGLIVICDGILFFVFLLLLFVCIGSDKKSIVKFGVIAGVGTILYMSLFVYLGRVVERVTDVVWLAAIIVFVYLLLREYDFGLLMSKLSLKYIYVCIISTFILSFVAYYCIYYSAYNRSFYINEEVVAYKYLSDKPENVYICNTLDFLSTCLGTEPYKSVPSNYLNNKITTGSSICSSPLFYNQLDNYDLNNIFEDMLTKENVYFVQKKENNFDILFKYYMEHYGYKCNYEIVDEGAVYNIYKLYVE